MDRAMVTMMGTLPMMVVVYWALPCSAKNDTAEDGWKDLDLKDNKTLMIAQQAMDFVSNAGFEYDYVLEVLSAKFSAEGNRQYYMMTFTTVQAYCSTYKPFVRDKCTPRSNLPSDQCTAYVLMVPKEEFVQVTKMECHETEPHDSHPKVKDQ
ncbi:uncharacterized protein LOC125946532 [Dermacentor silvarum]|uniref:uncharacterized protein LOC125946532 n=1 Tax=Dermacentor silvarum TaxID=543639 RepID=UPI002100ED2A|nr:uncharacterized protein LOC125946532 [Dermacentor silvarum]